MAPKFNPHLPPTSKTSGYKPRHVAMLANNPLLGNTKLASHMQRAVLRSRNGYQNPLSFLSTSTWLSTYVRDFFRHKIPYPQYANGQTGIFNIDAPTDGPLTMAMTADWGTGTLESDHVGHNIRAAKPHYTVHLGDVYFMGDAQEVDENWRGVKSASYNGVAWPHGSHGSFALMGNHEMYSGGHAYMERLLTDGMGLGAKDAITQPQSASYFCLNTPHWLIFGLDTAYHSAGLPILEEIPIFRSIPALNEDAHFNPMMLAWLDCTIAQLTASGDAHKPVIVLTHHQPLSSFEIPFPVPARQLAKIPFFRDRDFLWLHGHEHRLALYNYDTTSFPGLRMYPRCIGHGGMPVSLSKLTRPDPRLAWWDPRTHPIDEHDTKTLVGYNGHVNLHFEGEAVRIDYIDIDGESLLTERFTPQQGQRIERTEPSNAGMFRTGKEPS